MNELLHFSLPEIGMLKITSYGVFIVFLGKKKKRHYNNNNNNQPAVVMYYLVPHNTLSQNVVA